MTWLHKALHSAQQLVYRVEFMDSISTSLLIVRRATSTLNNLSYLIEKSHLFKLSLLLGHQTDGDITSNSKIRWGKLMVKLKKDVSVLHKEPCVLSLVNFSPPFKYLLSCGSN